jgi:hypothetical protein
MNMVSFIGTTACFYPLFVAARVCFAKMSASTFDLPDALDVMGAATSRGKLILLTAAFARRYSLRSPAFKAIGEHRQAGEQSHTDGRSDLAQT